jgi:hypothetical protein
LEQPELAAAMGALLLATRGERQDFRTKMSLGLLAANAGGGTGFIELPAGDVMVIDQDAMTDRKLAWSQTEFPEVPVRFDGDSYNEEEPACFSMRLNVIESPKEPPWRRRRFRLSQLLIGLCAVVAVTAIGGVAITLTAIERRPAPPPAPIVPTVAPPLPSPSLNSVAPSPVPPPPSAPPAPSPVPAPTSEAPPPPPPPPPPPSHSPSVVTTTKAPPVMTTTPPPPPSTTTTEPPVAETTTSTAPSMTTQWIHVPLLPVPIPVPVPANQAPQNQAPQVPQTQAPQNPFRTGVQ